ncbi:MAG: nucleotidyltransferase domain-containing protein [Phycisphaerae bacterium]|nr:nucleotidyltransferase domain-containing protein [Phycisphaerae bacterium]
MGRNERQENLTGEGILITDCKIGFKAISAELSQFAIELPLEEIQRFCEHFGVERMALFGSVLTDRFLPDSDVDVLLEFKPGHGFTFENTPDIDDELRRIFGRAVDVMEIENIRNPLRRRAILNSCRVIYGN